jgi:hypothetical protein
MSSKRTSITVDREHEDIEVFSETLRKIIQTPRENRGPAAQAVMSAFQVYYEMIGGATAGTNKLTR